MKFRLILKPARRVYRPERAGNTVSRLYRRESLRHIPVIRKDTKTYSAVLPKSTGTLIFAENTVFTAEEIKGSSYKIHLKTVFPECPCSLFTISAGNILTPTEPLELQSGSFSFPSPGSIKTGMVQYNDGTVFGLQFDVPRITFCKWVSFDSDCMEYRKDSGTVVMTKDASEVKVYDFPPDRYKMTQKGQLEADRRPSAPELSDVICDGDDTEYIRLSSGKEELCVKASDIEKDGENLYDWKKYFIELNQKDTDKYPYRECYYKELLQLVPGMEDKDKSDIENTPEAPASDYQKKYGAKYLHKMAVSHKSEFAEERVTDFGKEYGDEDKKDGYAYLRGNLFRKMTAVWGTGTTGLPGKGDDPEFVYFHPITFINHLYKLQTEINPYEGKKIVPRHPGCDKSKLGKHYYEKIVVTANPGFAPATETNKDSVRYPFFNSYYKKYFATINFGFKCAVYPTHTGIDFAGYEGDYIYSFIRGTVWACTYDYSTINTYPDKHCYGKVMLIKSANKLFLLAHLFDYCKKENDLVFPGDKVAQVGNTGYSDGAHLHLEVFNCSETDKDSVFEKMPFALKNLFKKNRINPINYKG